MNQEQLIPYFSNSFTCDHCERSFQQTTAYSLPNLPKHLVETYCFNCMVLEEGICSFSEIDNPIKQYTFCNNLLFDKKKQLCRSHNQQVWKRFNEFLKNIPSEQKTTWLEAWNQSGDWKYFWDLKPEKPTRRIKKLNQSDRRITGRVKQLNLKVREETYWRLKKLASKNRCLLTEMLEKLLEDCLKKKSSEEKVRVKEL